MRGSVQDPGGRARRAIADMRDILVRILSGAMAPSWWQQRQLRRWRDVIIHLGRPDDPAWGRIAQVTVIAFWLDAAEAVDERAAEGPLAPADLAAMIRDLDRAALLHQPSSQVPDRPLLPLPGVRRREPVQRTASHGRDHHTTARLRGVDVQDR
ncbi:hypothetical protein E9232_005633 [Inquilinus ginsengisoli]|uniref:Uncharacterized protein n=1 Tax=Inquilinus ginsengisoli TaxID=363840 RepID=A0ABU1JWU8_9PROT|nr:hypothetical protein [Inquilinus ginsengisoli]MDR6293088.1 hypothetical protein [Inquilinus ginsengisoli]